MIKPLQVIEDSFISKMLRNPLYTAAFPFLRGPAAAARKHEKDCRRCGSKGQTKSVDYSGIKKQLAEMPKDRLRKLVDLVGAEKVRIIYKNNAGETIKITF